MLCTKKRASKLERVFFGEDTGLAEKLADVHFEVTDVLSGEQRVFPSLRGLCASVSAAMEALLFGPMEEARFGSTVPITNCRVHGFRWLLAYFYGLQPALTVDNVVAVLQCADLFIVEEVTFDCIAFISEEMHKEMDMLPILGEIERLNIGSIPALKGVMDSFFGDAFFEATAVESQNFAKSPIAVVSAVLRSDELPITEERLWQKILEWAKLQYAYGRRVADSKVETEEAKSAEDTGDAEDGDWRDLLRPFLPLIRFPVMDQKFFSAEVVASGLLSDSQVASVTRYSADCQFSVFPRDVTKAECGSQLLSFKEWTDLRKKVAAICDTDLRNCELLYRGSEHPYIREGRVMGFSTRKFHELCDEKGPTLTVVLTEFGHVIGGFASVPWTSKGGYKRDNDAWLFVSHVNDSKKPQFSDVSLPAILTAIVGTDIWFHVRHYGGDGPTFGDWYISGQCKVGRYCSVKHVGAFDNLCDGVTLSCVAVTGGSDETVRDGKSEFNVVDYEVFAVK